MYHAKEVLQVVFPSYRQTAEVLEPGEETFYLPTPPVGSQGASILAVVLSVAPMGSDNLDSGLGQIPIKLVGIVSVVPYEALYGFSDEDLSQRLVGQSHFVRRCRFCTHCHRQTSAVCHCHDLGPFAALGLAYTRAPLFAGAKVPSMKASRRWNLPRTCRSSARASSMPRITPERTHC
jgi:hypothetical protein